jgi:hypothetical protein
MNSALFIGLVILVGVSLGWVLHQRATRRMSPILTRLAAEMNGKVESSSLFLMPTLRFWHSGTEVEISTASTGIAGESVRYTYALFAGLNSKNFMFRILPRSLQTIGDKWIMKRKPMSTGVDKLDKCLAIYTNNDPLMKSVLSERIQADLLSWAEQKRENKINAGDLESYEEYKLLLDTACRFYDAVINVMPNSSKASNSI